MDGYAFKGGGLAFWSNQNHVHFKTHHMLEKQLFDRSIQNLIIRDATFYNNSALKPSDALYIAHNSHDTTNYLKHITIINCTFIKGRGSTVDIIQHSLQPMTPFLNTTITMCSFKSNAVTIHSDYGVILKIYSDKVSLVNSTFTGNNSTAISLSSAYLNLRGNISFENNSARLGGAMKINEASLVFVYKGTHVCFINNRAEEKGGAIYVKISCMDSSVSTLACLLHSTSPTI